MAKISICNLQSQVPIPPNNIRKIVGTVLNHEKVNDFNVTVAFVDNPTIHRLNRQFLSHDEPTDVLTFPSDESTLEKISGEIVVGVEVARDQARARGHSIQAELALYVIHGLLHLCGYDDRRTKPRKTMRLRERFFLKLLKFPVIAEKD